MYVYVLEVQFVHHPPRGFDGEVGGNGSEAPWRKDQGEQGRVRVGMRNSIKEVCVGSNVARRDLIQTSVHST